MERLTLHASCKLARRVWHGRRVKPSTSVLKGWEAGDFASDAVVTAVEGRRTWDRDAQPSFEKFLRGIIDSRMSAFVRSAENKRARVPPIVPSTGEPAGPDASSSSILAPDVLVEDAELKEKARAAVAKEDAGITRPAEVAEMLGRPIEDIYNAQKRFDRRLATVAKRLEQGTKP